MIEDSLWAEREEGRDVVVTDGNHCCFTPVQVSDIGGVPDGLQRSNLTPESVKDTNFHP